MLFLETAQSAPLTPLQCLLSHPISAVITQLRAAIKMLKVTHRLDHVSLHTGSMWANSDPRLGSWKQVIIL